MGKISNRSGLAGIGAKIELFQPSGHINTQNCTVRSAVHSKRSGTGCGAAFAHSANYLEGLLPAACILPADVWQLTANTGLSYRQRGVTKIYFGRKFFSERRMRAGQNYIGTKALRFDGLVAVLDEARVQG